MNRVSISQIEAFYWVADLGAVHKAAAKLGITQPTVSLRLKQLEAELGAPIFERAGRGLRLTRNGHVLLQKAKLVLEAHAEMRLATSSPPVAGTMRIGLAEGFAVACLPLLVPALAHELPLLRPEWTVTTSWALEQGLIEGELDLAVLVDAIGHSKVRLEPLGLQPNSWAHSPSLRIREGASPTELARFTTITTPPPTSMYRNTIAWFAEAGQKPGPLCICTSVNAAAQLVAAGIGIGIFPWKMIEAYKSHADIAAIRTRPPIGTGKVHIASRETGGEQRTESVMRIVEKLVREVGYFDGV